MKRIHVETNGSKTAKVYHDSNWQEYRIRLYIDGVLHAFADCFESTRADAIDSAFAMVGKRPPIAPEPILDDIDRARQ